MVRPSVECFLWIGDSVKNKLIKGSLSILILALVMMMPLIQGQAKKKVRVKSVKVTSTTGKSVYVAKGKKAKLTTTVKVTPNKKTYKKVTYKSSKRKIATVSTTGKITGKKVGKATITVTSKKNKKKKTKITVHVVKALTKIKMNRKATSVNEGETTTLSVSYTPKTGTYKKLRWASSDMKVATVKDGVITGVKAGVAKITAYAKDGTNRYTTCMVAVLSKNETPNLVDNGIQRVEAVSSGVIRVHLTKAETLEKSQLSVKSKQFFTGTYLSQHDVDRIRTTDSIVYDIFLKQEIAPGKYIQFSIQNAGQTRSSETVANYLLSHETLPEQIVTTVTGSSIQVKVDLEESLRGNRHYFMIGLPAGFKSETVGHELRIVGRSNKIINNVIATAIATDEMGQTISKKVRFLIGGSDRLVGCLSELKVMAGKSFSLSLPIHLAGTSSDVMMVVEKPTNLTVSKDCVEGILPEGKYTYTIRYGLKTMSGVIRAVPSTLICGQATAGATIRAYSYDGGEPVVAVADESGRFEMNMLPGIYDIYANWSERQDCYVKFDTSNAPKLVFDLGKE